MVSESKNSKTQVTTRQFEYVDEKSSKFWEISHGGLCVLVRFGKIGTEGQTQIKEFESQADAEGHASKLIAEKTKKGYSEMNCVAKPLPMSKKPAVPQKSPSQIASDPLKEVESKIAEVQKRFKSLLEKYADNDWVAEQSRWHTDNVASIAPCWKFKTRSYYSESADRTVSMLSGPFFCCKKYPWPKFEGAFMEPVVQLDLRTVSKLRGLDFGDGLLQVFYSNSDPEGLLRVIPREVLEYEEPSATPAMKDFTNESFRTPTDWYQEDGTFEEIVGFSKPLISSTAEIDDYDEDDLPKALKAVCKQITAMKGNDYSSHMFGTFAYVQYGASDMPPCLINFEEAEHGYNWGDGSAQVFYEFADGTVKFTFNTSCG